MNQAHGENRAPFYLLASLFPGIPFLFRDAGRLRSFHFVYVPKGLIRPDDETSFFQSESQLALGTADPRSH